MKKIEHAITWITDEEIKELLDPLKVNDLRSILIERIELSKKTKTKTIDDFNNITTDQFKYLSDESLFRLLIDSINTISENANGIFRIGIVSFFSHMIDEIRRRFYQKKIEDFTSEKIEILPDELIKILDDIESLGIDKDTMDQIAGHVASIEKDQRLSYLKKKFLYFNSCMNNFEFNRK